MFRTRNIVCAVDFSEGSKRALQHALDLAAGGGDVHVLHVFRIEVLVTPDGGLALPAETMRAIEADQKAALAAMVAPFRTGDVTLTEYVRNGDPADEAVSLAGDVGADLIVVGTHGRRGLSRLVLGSVAERIVRTSPVPVLTVRTPE